MRQSRPLPLKRPAGTALTSQGTAAFASPPRAADVRVFIPRPQDSFFATITLLNWFSMVRMPATGSLLMRWLKTPGTVGSRIVPGTLLISSDTTTATVTMIRMSGAPRNLILTATGLTRLNMVMSGVRVHPLLAVIPIGRLTDMEAGCGVRHTVGPGLQMNPGDGHLITTVAGSITTTPGDGLRVDTGTTIIAPGGVRHL